MKKEYMLKDDGINWIWYCHVVCENGIATVLEEYRLHKFDESQGSRLHPKTNGYYRIEEQKTERKLGETFAPRIAIGIRIDGYYVPFAKPIPRWDVGKTK